MLLSNRSQPLCLPLTPDQARLMYHKYMTSMFHLPVSDERGERGTRRGRDRGEGEREGREGGRRERVIEIGMSTLFCSMWLLLVADCLM